MAHPDEMQIVQRFADQHPVDVESLIRELGIQYDEIPMPSGDSGRIKNEGWTYRIVVNRNEGPQRRRFTAAHELGHYLMHRDLLDGRGHLDRLFDQAGRDNPSEPLSPEHEVQANQFAADLLMPAREIKRLYDKWTDNVHELARMFDVSPAAMRIRLKNLRLRP